MPMNKKEAFEIIELVSNVYNMEFTEKKLDLWIDFLCEDGDYEPSLKMAKKYIKDGNVYPPKIPNILRHFPKVFKEEEPDDKTKSHRWKMANDPEYVESRKRALEQFRQKVAEFDRRGDDFVE
ncbi:hypothetical protein [Staphylococcus kloosii]|uniref:Replicative helicase inhibitor G39P N-terminal domain-containing protein n=1 Tax=Staphylococcus kloosii TaxID=29384 RepID=A0ABQ0XJ06_9STAP|nr:hypothetical protein [Staphylococcus kloosii]AVQ36612.1 hypothetical protein C7J89_10765 [Staphylococcus kloosii]PNZ03960.1 hypothetical protein CD136_09845 [Staphylococcus kloosii]GEP81436.1 hypothetical protein SKL01_06140 [Staphylococcus kloosii]SUM49703.1 phage protein [Staphylococcus kloosii]